MHEVIQQKADSADDLLFDYHIAPDPTLLLKNPIVFKTGRLVPPYTNIYSLPSIPTIGSFGFATPNKGFEQIVKAVQDEFDEAVIRFNIPSADFGDSDGSNAKKIVEQCQQLIKKPGIKLSVYHDFLSSKGVLDFLAQNTINVFLYQDKNNRGLSSTPDYALAVNRPLAVSDSIMFRHLHDITPSIEYGKSSLQNIIKHGASSYSYLQNEWSSTNLVWEYERIITAILKKEQEKQSISQPNDWKTFKKKVRILLGLQAKKFTWLRNTERASEDTLTPITVKSYIPITLPEGISINRILDNSARQLYQPAVIKLEELVPLTMAKKIPEANVQQAFVFDTVQRFIVNYDNPAILCVGSYEDTASMSLKRIGLKIEEIDPVLNYYLQEYYSKPGIGKNSFDIIFSTSVIEHDPDDESFIKCIEGLLKPGGIAILTCDYKDGWKAGDPKPDVDARFYTMYDLKERILSYIPECHLIDTPQWECDNPDFNYLGKYQYTFATFVIQKNK
ncbi:MAG: methyltransferase domain-containing protein [Agriterribacter sp.]